MIPWYGYRPASSTIYMPFHSFTAATGASAATSNFVAGDILIYKDGGTTQRSSANGITASTTFDSQTGLNLVAIDLSDNTDAGFYAAGHSYAVAVADVTIDSQTVRFWLGSFDIGPAQVDVRQLLGTAWLTPGTAGTPDVNVKLWNALTTVALPLIPTTAGRTLDVSTTGEAGVDWANVGSPTTTLALTGTTIAVTQKVDVDTIKTNPVVNGGTATFPTNATLASTANITAATGVDITKILGTAISTPATAGILDVNLKNIANAAVSASTAQLGVNVVNNAGSAITAASGIQEVKVASIAANAITATAIAADAITDAKVASDVTIASVTGAVGSVTGAVGSVTGNVTGSIGSLAAQAQADVNAEVVDALATDTYVEPGQGAPAATASLAAKLNYLFKAWRNKTTQNSSEYRLYADDASTIDHKAAVSDDATTFTRGEVATGP